MKVLHLRSGSFVGSPERLILGQVQALKDNVCSEVAVLPDGSDAFYRTALAAEVTSHLLPGGRFPAAAVWRLARLIRRRGYDVLCTHDYKSNLVGWLAARLARCRQIAIFHGRTGHNVKSRTYESLDNLVLRRLDAVVAVSEATRRRLSFLERLDGEGRGAANGPVHVIRNALDIRRLEGSSMNNYRETWGLGSEDVLIATSGRLSPEKGHLVLLEAFQKTLESNDRLYLAIAGAGRLRPILEREIARRGLENRVRLLGFLNDPTPLYRAMDIFVLPSFTEGLPLVVLEAGFFGKPVVATDVGGVREAAKDGISALLIPPGSPDALSRALLRLTEDKGLRERLGRGGREVVEREFSFSEHARRYQQLYDRLSSPRTLWVTWEIHRRTREIARAIGMELIELHSRRPRIIKHPYFLAKTVWCLIRRRPDVLFVQCPSVILAAWALFWRAVFGYRLVVDVHNEAVSPSKHPWVEPLLRFLHRKADLTIVTNLSLQRIVEKNGGRAFVLPDCIPFFPAAENKSRSNPAAKGRTAVFICSFAQDEPYEEVIEAARSLEGFVLYVTGNPARLDEKIQRRLPDNVRLTGYLPDRDYLNLLRRADILIDLTTREDCLVCGAYEAVALGKPLVLSDTRALRSYFVRGPVFVKNDRRPLAQGVIKAWERREDLAREMVLLKRDLEDEWSARRDTLLNLLHARKNPNP